MKKYKIMLFFILISFPLISMPSYLTAECLLSDCEAALDIYAKNSGYIQVEDNYKQGMRTGICTGYLSSVKEIYFSQRNLRNKSCSFPDTPLIKEIAIVVKYIKDHPQQYQLPASVVVLNAFKYYSAC